MQSFSLARKQSNTVSNTSGGAIFANTSGTKIVIDGSTFSENRTAEADDRGADGAMSKVDTVNANAGGAIFIEASNSALNIDNTLFYGNTVNKGTSSRNGYGGAIGASNTNINIAGSTFTNNRAYGGGAIYVRSNTNTISGSLFYQNYAQNGALALYNGSNNTISNNTVLVEVDGGFTEDDLSNYLTFEVNNEVLRNVLTVPSNAVDRENGKNFVYVMEGGIIQKKYVVIRTNSTATVWVQEGLSAGQTLIIE